MTVGRRRASSVNLLICRISGARFCLMQSSPRLGAASTSTSGSGQPSQPCRTLLRLTQRLHHRYITLSDGNVRENAR